MDQYTNYRFCDSLDYLIPPINKKQRNFMTKRSFENSLEIKENYLHKDSSPYIKRISDEKVEKKLAYAKDQRKIQTIFPYKNKNILKTYKKDDKPIIKITILPKSIETQTSKVFNKRIFKRNIKSTRSNHDGFQLNKINSVSGKKREKIHEIKTSESDVFFTKRNKFTNFDLQSKERQERNSSINMNTNSYKDKRKKYRKKDLNEDPRKCKLSNCPERQGCDVNRHKSRVTIVGQLGLTEDDRYVLNCAATLNDKPIRTNITQDMPTMNSRKTEPSAFSRPHQSYGGSKEYARYENLASTNFLRMESQGIQVSLLNDPDIKTTQAAMKNKYSQCACTSTSETFKLHENVTKGYQSPVVVISVYPNQESHIEGPLVKVEERQVPPSRPEVEQKLLIKEKKSEIRRPISPKELLSNKKLVMRSTDNNQLLNRKSTSPNRFSNSTRKQYTLLGSSKTNVSKTKSYIKSDRKVKPTKKVSQTKQGVEIRNQKKREIENFDVNQTLAKKALVDNYINSLEIEKAKDKINSSRNNYIPSKNNASKVTVNIDGETERYDLLFKHDIRNTDFSVRKTLKSKKKKDITSMENLLLSDSKMVSSSSVSHNSPLEFGSIHSPSPKRNERRVKNPSNLNVRDSIELVHGRTSIVGPKEKKPGKNNISYNMKNNYDDKGGAKHYRGDPCLVPDPSERDKEIRQLLGILTGRNLQNGVKKNTKQSQESFVVKNCEGNCTETEYNKKRIKLSSSLAKLFPKDLVTKLRRKKDESNTNINNGVQCRDIRSNELQNKKGCVFPSNAGMNGEIMCTNTFITNAMQSNRNMTSQNYYNESVNRNIPVVLYEEQNKQKHILLTRKQYNKVKRRLCTRTNQNTIFKRTSNERRKAILYSNVSIGEVRMKSNFQPVVRSNKEVQTENVNIKNATVSETRTLDKSEPIIECWFSKNMIGQSNYLKDSINMDDKSCRFTKPRRVVSSVEVRYASVSFMKKVTYSSPTFSKVNSSYSEERGCNSVHTIFKGHKKSITPNLGTSAFSLSSKELSSSQRSIFMGSKKKPLLQRLVSCLIMRSKISDIKMGKPQQNQPTRYSSINSYNISTSFAGMEMTSSLYDTSASFYSNHTIMPVSKMKRSFFSSVKGFLTHHRN